jgi:DNA-binding MarR family transcriptional regulator
MKETTMNGSQLMDLYRVARILHRHLEMVIESRIGDARGHLVLDLIHKGVDTPTELADAMRDATPTVSHILTRLEGEGLIERRKDLPDRRQFQLVLTAAGRLHLLSGLEAIGGRVRTGVIGTNSIKAMVRAADRIN